MFTLVKGEMRADKKKLKLRAMGISNWAYDSKSKGKNKRYSVQFYDYDYNGAGFNPKDVKRILEIFPYDCIMYESKHGVHFISFSLLRGLNYTKAKVLETSKDLGDQDYWTEQKDLTLRISPKWKVKRSGKRIVVSETPIFKGLVKKPNKYRISKGHLEFYRKYMDLPDWVYELYDDCIKRDYRIRIYNYKTRD